MRVRTQLLALVMATSTMASAALTIEKAKYQGWQNGYLIINGAIELVVTGDVGPRIMRFGSTGGQNLLKEYAEQLGESGEEGFQLRGGHRVWKAPEDPMATWAPDNSPVNVRITATGVIAREPAEPLTGLQKEIEVDMAPAGGAVRVIQCIANMTLFPLEFAPSALTMMAQGGTAITGFPPRGKHPVNLEATNPLVMWAYTDLADKRWGFTKKYLTLRQDPGNSEPQKIGHFNLHTWAAYLLKGDLFVKRYEADPSRPYPDFGCSFETFTNAEFLGIETLGPLTKGAPTGSVEHVEHWSLQKRVHVPEFTDVELDKVILPCAKGEVIPC